MSALQSFPSRVCIHVLLVDDYDLVRQGLRLLLNQCAEMCVVGEAWSGAQAVELAQREQPDIVLLDLELGRDNGLDFLPRLREVSRAKIIVYTGVVDEALRYRALALGASDIALKGDSNARLLDDIRRVHAGEGRAPEPEWEKIARLTSLERELIARFCEGTKEAQIGDQLVLSSGEVRQHLASIERKLEVHGPVQLVVYAFRHGLANDSLVS